MEVLPWFAPAIALVPLSRFGDTAANAGMLALLENSTWTNNVALKTAAASATSMVWRALLMPLVVLKTALQVGGPGALAETRAKVARLGVFETFFNGCIATMAAQFLGHWPWWTASNALEEWIPQAQEVGASVLRAACIGCAASILSDTITNSIRVVNTFRQTSEEDLTYGESVRRVVATSGLVGLLTRGLGAKMLVNCLNSIIFKVLVKLWY